MESEAHLRKAFAALVVFASVVVTVAFVELAAVALVELAAVVFA